MKKLNLLLLTLLALWGATATADVVFDETNFPDENFREAIMDTFWDDYRIRINEGDVLTDEMLNMEFVLWGEEYDIHSVQGIEFFTGLTDAILDMNQIEEIDFSHNPQLQEFDLSKNPIKRINLLGCHSLKQMIISPWTGQEGQLEELNLSDCTSLKVIRIYNEPIVNLDLSHNTLLSLISLEGLSSITSLDLTHIKKINKIECVGLEQLSEVKLYAPNPIDPIDIGMGNGINKAFFYDNPNLKSIDVSGQYLLDQFVLQNCDLITHMEFPGCSSLRELQIGRNENLETVDLSECENLENLSIYENQILKEFDLSTSTVLKSLSLRACPSIRKLIGLRQTAATLESLIISNNLTSIDLNNFPKLNYLDVSLLLQAQYISPGNHLNAISLENDNSLVTLHYETINGRQIQVYQTNVDGAKQYYIPLATTSAHLGIKDLIEQENNYEDEDTGFDWARVVTESITGATLGELDGEQVLWLDPTTTGATEGLHRMTYQYLTHCPNEQYATVEFYLDWAEATGMTGDVNGDGKVAIDDVTALIDYLLSGDATGINLDNADVNGEGDITIADVTALIDILLTGNN